MPPGHARKRSLILIYIRCVVFRTTFNYDHVTKVAEERNLTLFNLFGIIYKDEVSQKWHDTNQGYWQWFPTGIFNNNGFMRIPFRTVICYFPIDNVSCIGASACVLGCLWVGSIYNRSCVVALARTSGHVQYDLQSKQVGQYHTSESYWVVVIYDMFCCCFLNVVYQSLLIQLVCVRSVVLVGCVCMPEILLGLGTWRLSLPLIHEQRWCMT